MIGRLDFRRIRVLLTAMAGILILLIGLVVLRLDNHEYIHHREMVNREGSNLLLAFEENVRRDLDGVDEILREIQTEYQIAGGISPTIMARIQRLRSSAFLFVSLTDAQGRVVVSSRRLDGGGCHGLAGGPCPGGQEPCPGPFGQR